MNEHLTQKQLEDYCRRRLPAAELLSVSQHIGDCQVCRQQIESAVETGVAFFALRSNLFDEFLPAGSLPHLTAAQISNHVDNQLSGEELQFVTDHLHHCDECVLAVDDVRAFSKEVAPLVSPELSPSAKPATTESWWQRTFAPLAALFRPSPVPVLGMALAVLLLVVIGWLFVRRLQEQQPKQEVAAAPTASPQATAPVLPSPSPAARVEPDVVAQLNDGKSLLSLDREGKLSGADELPATYQNLVKKALSTRQVEKSALLEGLQRPPSSLMSANKEKGEFS
ncbi:MAG TPA: zf-HC2 domain-containing protein, partial [Pyrinomonadaceae bacterium]|nr:zf-HC2 domain-containing protein [Pyrinomonadaceae bacterium]